MKKHLFIIALGCTALLHGLSPIERYEQLRARVQEELPQIRQEFLDSPLEPAYKGRAAIGAVTGVLSLGCMRNGMRLIKRGKVSFGLLSLTVGTLGTAGSSILAYDGFEDAKALWHDLKAYIKQKIDRTS